MWPTEYSIYLIILGFIPLIYILIKIYKFGFYEITSLRSIFVILNWLSYHFLPFLAIFNDSPSDYILDHTVMPSILVFNYIDTSLIFSFLSIISFIIGYNFIAKNYKFVRRYNKSNSLHVKININIYLIVFLAYIVSSIYSFGGIDEFIFSSKTRGEGQHDADLFQRTVRIIVSILSVIIATLSSILILEKRNKIQFILGIISFLYCMSVFAYKFSRVTGFPLFVLSFLMLRFYRRKLWKVILLFIIGLYLGNVGLQKRNDFNPGVGNYIIAVFSSLRSHEDDKPWKNPLSGTESFTIKAEMRENINDNSILYNIYNFLKYINPLPSFLIDTGTIGMDIRDYLGITGDIGITSPAFSDVYYLFSYFGSIIFLFLGMMYAYIDMYNMRINSNLSKISVLLAILSIGEGIHKTIRSHTRGLIYGIVLIFIEKKWRKIK